MEAETPALQAPGGPSGPALELIGIDKRFGAVHANRAVSLRVSPGSIHGLIGENGAGKSTLMNIVYGFHRADSGEIRVNGRRVEIARPRDSIAAGIGMVHQHFMLVERFSVLENVILGAEGGARLGKGLGEARAGLERPGRRIRPSRGSVGRRDRSPSRRKCSSGWRSSRRCTTGQEILILDEPTAVLTPAEVGQFFRMLALLRDQGKTVILVTHKLREIMAVTDRVTVMRQGTPWSTRTATRDTTPKALAEQMVGRAVLLKLWRSALPAPATCSSR